MAEICSRVTYLTRIRVPRCYFVSEQVPVHHQIHGSSDASEKAYAAVVYLRTVYNNNGGKVGVNKLL